MIDFLIILIKKNLLFKLNVSKLYNLILISFISIFILEILTIKTFFILFPLLSNDKTNISNINCIYKITKLVSKSINLFVSYRSKIILFNKKFQNNLTFFDNCCYCYIKLFKTYILIINLYIFDLSIIINFEFQFYFYQSNKNTRYNIIFFLI
jgi:hypothetical protein